MEQRSVVRQTRWSLVLQAGGERTEASRRALAELCRTYRPALLAWARRLEADSDRAEEVVQDFLARLVERDIVGAADPARGRFRAFLRTALRHHWSNMRGRQRWRPEAAVDEVVSGGPSADRLLDRLWARVLLDRALERVRQEQVRDGKGARFELLGRRLAGDDEPPLRDIAATLGMTTGAVKVALFHLRQRYHDLVREEVAETVAHVQDVDGELRDLLDSWSDDDDA